MRYAMWDLKQKISDFRLRIGKDERSTSNVQRSTSNEENHHQIFFIQRSMLDVHLFLKIMAVGIKQKQKSGNNMSVHILLR